MRGDRGAAATRSRQASRRVWRGLAAISRAAPFYLSKSQASEWSYSRKLCLGCVRWPQHRILTIQGEVRAAGHRNSGYEPRNQFELRSLLAVSLWNEPGTR